MNKGVMSDIRVLDLATFLAGPFCGTIFAEFGAEVIKVEQPNVGDPLRKFGRPTEVGDSMIWLSESRNKKSITLDLRTEEGVEICKDLVKQVDVVIENFRPGTLEKWGLGFETLRALNPSLVMLRISGYGQTGPYKGRPGFARVAHAFSGLVYLAGEKDGPPVMPGSTSMADYIAGTWGAIGVLMALREKERSGKGQFIDIGLYEPIFRYLDELVPSFAHDGFIRERMGADTVNIVPHSHYRTSDGNWVAIACTGDKMFVRLANAMGTPEVARDPRYDTNPKRLERREEVNALVSQWTNSLPAETVLSKLNDADVPSSLIYSIQDIFADPHYRARGNIHDVKDGRIPGFPVPNIVPVLSETPGEVRTLGPGLGEHNIEVYGRLLGFDKEKLKSLIGRGVI